MHARTRRQSEVLAIIVEYIKRHGHQPSYAVIARHLGLRSRAGIGRIVRELESQGLLSRRRENGHFYLDIGAADAGNAPAGGVTIEWLDPPRNDGSREPWQECSIVLPEFMLGSQTPESVRAYRVTDGGMAAEDIREDDIAIVELRQFVRDGDSVVAIVDKHLAVLRKYYRSGADVELRPAGEFRREDVVRLAADRIEVVAVYRALLRPIN